MNVYRFELKSGLKSALCWAVALAATGLFLLGLYPAFQRDLEPMLALLRNYPEPVLRAMGLSAGALNSFSGFFGFLNTYVLLCASVQALSAGIACISKEGARRTADFLFARPRKRPAILLAKYLAALTLAMFVGLCYALATCAGGLLLADSVDARGLWLMNGAFLLTQVFCVSIGFCVGCFARRIKAPGAVGLALGALFFAVQLLANLTRDARLALLTPSGYLTAVDALARGGYDPARLAALLALSAACFLTGLWRYARKDLH